MTHPIHQLLRTPNFKSPFEIGGEKEMGICLIASKGDQLPMGPQLPNGTTTVTLLVARCSNLRVPPQLQRHFHEECAQSHINICHDRREVLQLVGNVTNLMIQKKNKKGANRPQISLPETNTSHLNTGFAIIT